MPFGISQQQIDCDTWATVKEETDGTYTTIGCHATKQDAIDQMVTVSMSEKIDPLGEIRAQGDMIENEPVVESGSETDDESDLTPRQSLMHETYEQIAEQYGKWSQSSDADGAHYVAESPFSADGLVCANCVFYIGGRKCELVSGDISPAGICKLWIIAEQLITTTTEPTESPEMAEVRAEIDLSAPDFMRRSAKRGLALHEEGKSGDGLMPATVADARRMANGTISEAKWRKIGAWIARHIVDLEAVDGSEITAGLVAMLLWGGGSSKASALRAQRYAERIVARLDADEQRADSPAPKKDQIEDGEIRCTTDERATMLTTMTTDATTEQTTTENRWCVTGQDERRIAYTTLEMRESGSGNTLIGYAAVFDSPSEPMPFTEYVKRGAFAKTINDGADVRLLIDHEGVPLARTRSGTLSLTEDDRGLQVTAELDPMNPDAARIISAMRRGDISQMSFAFRTIQDHWSSDRMTRELREVQLFDVSVVTFPAYEETVAELRSKEIPTTVIPTTSVSVRKAQLSLARHR